MNLFTKSSHIFTYTYVDILNGKRFYCFLSKLDVYFIYLNHKFMTLYPYSYFIIYLKFKSINNNLKLVLFFFFFFFIGTYNVYSI